MKVFFFFGKSSSTIPAKVNEVAGKLKRVDQQKPIHLFYSPT